MVTTADGGRRQLTLTGAGSSAALDSSAPPLSLELVVWASSNAVLKRLASVASARVRKTSHHVG